MVFFFPIDINLENQPIKISGDGLYQAQVNLQSSFIINVYSSFNPTDEVKIIIHPSTYTCHMQIINNHNGIWTINYTPNKNWSNKN